MVIFVALEPAHKLFYGLKGTFLLSLSPFPLFTWVGQIGVGGTYTLALTVPELGVGIDDLKLHVQSYFWDTSGLEILGTAQSLFLLDDDY